MSVKSSKKRHCRKRTKVMERLNIEEEGKEVSLRLPLSSSKFEQIAAVTQIEAKG